MLTHSYGIFWDNQNRGNNATNFRLQKSKYRRLDRGPGKTNKRILFPDARDPNGRNFFQNHRRDLFPLQVSGENWKESFPRSPGQERTVPAARVVHRPGVQHLPRATVQVYPLLDQDSRTRNRTRLDAIDLPSYPGAKVPGFSHSHKKKKVSQGSGIKAKRNKPQAPGIKTKRNKPQAQAQGN